MAAAALFLDRDDGEQRPMVAIARPHSQDVAGLDSRVGPRPRPAQLLRRRLRPAEPRREPFERAPPRGLLAALPELQARAFRDHGQGALTHVVLKVPRLVLGGRQARPEVDVLPAGAEGLDDPSTRRLRLLARD